MKENIYTLFFGFRKLGEFKSILEAKKFVQDCCEGGIFNLIGTNYSNIWHISKLRINEQ